MSRITIYNDCDPADIRDAASVVGPEGHRSKLIEGVWGTREFFGAEVIGEIIVMTDVARLRGIFLYNFRFSSVLDMLRSYNVGAISSSPRWIFTRALESVSERI